MLVKRLFMLKKPVVSTGSLGEIMDPDLRNLGEVNAAASRVDQRFILDSAAWSPPLIGRGLWLKHTS